MAPELRNQESYGSGVDIWALGVFTYMLLKLEPPFAADSRIEFMDQVSRLRLAAKLDGRSKVCQDFVSKMLVVD